MNLKMLKEILLFVCGQRRLYHVQGSSMYPLLRDGNLVLIKPKKENVSLAVGDLVLCKHPYKRKKIIKQLSFINQSKDRIYVKGLNELESEDSSAFGMLKSKDILGSVSTFFD